MYQGCFVTSLSCSHHHCHPFLYLTANRMHETNHTFLGTETGVISIALPSQSCMAWGDATRGSTLWLTWVGISHHSLHLSGHIISVVPMLLHNTSPRAGCRSWGLQYHTVCFLQSILLGSWPNISPFYRDDKCDLQFFPFPLHTLSSLIQPSAKYSCSPLIVILGYKEHDLDERLLWGMLESEVCIDRKSVV